MPTLTKWSPEEIAAATAQKSGGSRKAIEAEYDQLIADMVIGDWATLTPEAGEAKTNLRNRLKGAARRRGVSIVFQRTKDDTVVFHLEQSEESEAT